MGLSRYDKSKFSEKDMLSDGKRIARRKKRSFTGITLTLVFFIGLSLILYPSLADYVNSKAQTKAIINYDAAIKDMHDEDFTDYFSAADKYNEEIRKIGFPLLHYDEVAGYESCLDITGTGIMGYISIDKIKVELPIYHGVSASVLNVAVGHMPGTSLPVGGAGAHCVLSAHRGLPSARLFTDLDRLEAGDIFEINVLNRRLSYCVDKISIVEPHEIDALEIVPDKDYCTLFTCTPYGINSHRLLVRGERISLKNDAPRLFVPSEAHMISPLVVTPIVAAPILLILLIWLLFVPVKKRRKWQNEDT